MTDKEFTLDLIKLLSALESWSFSAGKPLPDYLLDNLIEVVDRLTKEVLK